MDALTFYAVAFVVIWVLALLFKDKLKIDVTGPILMRRTTRLRDFIDLIAQKSPRFWRGFMTIGICVATFFMVLTFALLAYSLLTIIQSMFIAHVAVPATAGVYPVLPGVNIPGSPINPPLGYGLIALATVLVFHEFAHGILARAEGIKIKSIGVLLLAILPGAFVEPDEEQVKKAKRVSKLRIYAAGSIINLTLGALALLGTFLLASVLFTGTFASEGMQITSVEPNSPAYGVLKEGMIITNINGNKITSRNNFTSILNTSKPGDVLIITTNQGTFTIKTAPNPRNPQIGYVGVTTQENYVSLLPQILFILYNLFEWIFILNVGIGTVNLLPLKPLDGGLIFEELLNYVTSSVTANKITIVSSLVSVAIIISSLSLSLLNAYKII